MGDPRVIGLDLSLASTGVAGNAGGGWVARIRTQASTEPAQLARLRWIRGAVMDYVRHADLVMVEGLAMASTTGRHLTRAGLWHMVMDRIDAAGIPWSEVSPGTLKRYATGKGNASKDAVLAAVVRRFPAVEVTNADQADALVLAAMGADHLGHPLVPMPAAHRAALDAVAWPDQKGPS
jgi:crossover junction endodeoxyribonuclease RuvC